MNQSTNARSSHDNVPLIRRAALAALGASIGTGILWATVFFYTRVVDMSTFDVLNWVQPVMLAVSGMLCIIGALVVLKDARGGTVVVRFALSLLPLILVWRLVLVGFRMVERAAGWSMANADRIMDGSMLREWRPSWLVIANIVVVLLIVVGSVLNKVAQSSRKD